MISVKRSYPVSIELLLVYIRFKFLPLLGAGIPANRADVDHTIAEFNEGAALLRNLQVGDVLEQEVDQLLVLLLSQPLDEAVAAKRFAQAESGQSVLSEAEIE